MPSRLHYPIRCCCSPLTLFGWLEGPADVSEFWVPERLQAPVWNAPGSAAVPIHRGHRVQVMLFGRIAGDGMREHEHAIYSDDRPAEFWQALQGFTPASPEDIERAACGELVLPREVAPHA